MFNLFKTKPKYKTIWEIVEFESSNLSRYDLTDVDFDCRGSGKRGMLNLEKVTFPFDEDLFLKIKNRTISGIVLPAQDFSSNLFDGVSFLDVQFNHHCKVIYRPRLLTDADELKNVMLPIIHLDGFDFTGVSMSGLDFSFCKFGHDSDMFQKILNKDVSDSTFPHHDFSDYDFTGVDIRFTSWSHGCKLPRRCDLFQIVKDKSLKGCWLPEEDFSMYDFSGVELSMTKFSPLSKLPHNRELFQKLKSKNLLDSTLPKDTMENICFYDLTGCQLNLSNQKCSLSECIMLNHEYGENSKIQLPSIDYNYIKNTL